MSRVRRRKTISSRDVENFFEHIDQKVSCEMPNKSEISVSEKLVAEMTNDGESDFSEAEMVRKYVKSLYRSNISSVDNENVCEIGRRIHKSTRYVMLPNRRLYPENFPYPSESIQSKKQLLMTISPVLETSEKERKQEVDDCEQYTRCRVVRSNRAYFEYVDTDHNTYVEYPEYERRYNMFIKRDRERNKKKVAERFSEIRRRERQRQMQLLRQHEEDEKFNQNQSKVQRQGTPAKDKSAVCIGIGKQDTNAKRSPLLPVAINTPSPTLSVSSRGSSKRTPQSGASNQFHEQTPPQRKVFTQSPASSDIVDNTDSVSTSQTSEREPRPSVIVVSEKLQLQTPNHSHDIVSGTVNDNADNNRNKTVTEGGMTIQISDYDGANIIVASDATSDTCISTEFSFERQGPSPPSDSTGKRGRSPRARRVTLSPASARAIVSSVIEEDGKSNYEADNSVDISRSNYGAVNSDESHILSESTLDISTSTSPPAVLRSENVMHEENKQKEGDRQTVPQMVDNTSTCISEAESKCDSSSAAASELSIGSNDGTETQTPTIFRTSSGNTSTLSSVSKSASVALSASTNSSPDLGFLDDIQALDVSHTSNESPLLISNNSNNSSSSGGSISKSTKTAEQEGIFSFIDKAAKVTKNKGMEKNRDGVGMALELEAYEQQRVQPTFPPSSTIVEIVKREQNFLQFSSHSDSISSKDGIHVALTSSLHAPTSTLAEIPESISIAELDRRSAARYAVRMNTIQWKLLYEKNSYRAAYIARQRQKDI
jgi:hypothetical protein